MFGFRPLPQTSSCPRAIFDGICDVLCTSSTLQKWAVFLPPGAGRRHLAPPPIAKAKATPHAMRFNMPGIRRLVQSPSEQASACQPPTRPPCIAARGVTRGRAWYAVSHCKSFSHFFLFTILPHKEPKKPETSTVPPCYPCNTRLRHPILFPFRPRTHEVIHHVFWKLAPNFHDTGLEIEARFPATPPSGIGAHFEPGVGGIEPPTFCLQA